MKIVSFLQLFIIFTLVAFISSCKKHECPDPVDNTVYVATLTDGELQDAFVSSHYPNENTGTAGHLELTAWTLNGAPFTRRSFIKFDYASIPAGAIIKKATLTLRADTLGWTNGHSYPHADAAYLPNNWTLSKVTSNWNESTLTWNNKPSEDASTQVPLAASTSFKQTYSIDVTNFIQDEISSPSTAHGLVMQLSDGNYYKSIFFASSENADKTLRPTLEIEYSK